MSDLNFSPEVLKFLSSKQTLIVDESDFALRKVKKFFKRLGVEANSLFQTAKFSEAQLIIQQDPPGLVLSEYTFKGGSGFDLFRKLREGNFGTQSAFVLLTEESSHVKVAQAAEEEVDGYLIKPLILENFHREIENIIQRKIYPSDYHLNIERAKHLIDGQLTDDARKLLNRCLTEDPFPSLAQYYMGKCFSMEKESKQALTRFREGLRINSYHFRCLQGLYLELIKEGNLEEGYQTLKELVRFFPANLERFSEAVRYAIKIGAYRDIDEYFELFKKLDHSTEKESDYICAGLFICAKHYMGKDNFGKCYEITQALLDHTDRRPKYLLAIMELYFLHKRRIEVKEYFQRFYESEFTTEEYAIGQFIVSSYHYGPEELILRGGVLVDRKIENFTMEKIMLDSLIKMKEKGRAKKIIEKIQILWPERMYELHEQKNELEILLRYY